MAENKKKKPGTVSELSDKVLQTVIDSNKTRSTPVGGDSEQYSYMSEKLLDDMIEKSSSYSYDVNLDPLYNQYKDMYRKEGMLAAKDVFGLAGALTGGYGNSYASVSASGAYSDVMDKLTDVGLRLEEKNYDRYKDTLSSMKTAYEAYSDIADKKYAKETYESERLDEKAEKEKESKLEFAYKAAENGDFRYLEALGVDVSNLHQQDAFNDAEFLAKYKDYSGLKSLGIDISRLKEDDLSKQAELFAKYGDYSVLKELGFDASEMEEKELLDLAEVYAKYGDYSLLNSLGVNTSDREQEEYYDRLLTWARYLRALRW